MNWASTTTTSTSQAAQTTATLLAGSDLFDDVGLGVESGENDSPAWLGFDDAEGDANLDDPDRPSRDSTL